MNLRTIATRFAVAGVSTAVAASALVGAATTAASAETGSAVYSCANPLLPQALPIGVSSSAVIPLPALESGMDIPGGALGVPVTFTAVEAVVQGFAAYHVHTLSVSSDNFTFGYGPIAIPISGVTTPTADVPATGGLTMVADQATVGGFTVPRAGNYVISMPSAFDLNAVTDSLGTLPLHCTITDGSTASILSLPAVKMPTTYSVKAPKTIKKGKVLKIAVAASGAHRVPTGKVSAKEKAKKLGVAALKSGNAVVSVKGLKPGTHTIVVAYPGDGYNKGASKTIHVKVTR